MFTWYINRLFGLTLLLGLPLVSLAQFTLPGDSIQLEASPRFPEPNQTVAVTLNDYALDTTGSTITWVINGETNTQFTNQRSISVVAGALGERQTIGVLLTHNNGQTTQATQTITPTILDLVVEANTYTPNWFIGRPVPSIGSSVRVVALPNLGIDSAPQSYNYTWRLNNAVLGGGSITGGNIQTFTLPLGRNSTLQVDVSNRSGEVIASKSIIIPHVEPQLAFYELNPLRGTQPIALGEQVPLIGAEINITAEPFYMDQTIFAQNPLIEWNINNRVIDNPNLDPQVITLQNGGGTGAFDVGFHIRNLAQLLQGAEGEFKITF